MDGLKRVGILVAVAVVALLFSSSFDGSDILERAVIIGIGVDKSQSSDNNIVLTAEVVRPGNGQEQVGLFSKIVSATGATVGEAILELGRKTGKEPSPGQCGLLVFGESFYRQSDVTDVVDFFSKSSGFRENSVVCCCEGSAEELFNKSDALNGSVSLAITSVLREQAKKIAVPSNTLLEFARSQNELSQSGFLNVVSFSPSQNKDSNQGDEKQGFFLYDRTAIFVSNRFLCDLSSSENDGFAFLNDGVDGNTMSLLSDDGRKYALRVNGKKVDKSYENGNIEIKISLQVRLARAGTADVGGPFTVKDNSEIPLDLLDEFKQRVFACVDDFLVKQASANFDVVDLHEQIRQKEGTTDKLKGLATAQIPVSVSIFVEEK